MTNVVRYPLPHWPEELDEHERQVEEWEGEPVADTLARKLNRIDELHADNHADAHPSFERLARAEAVARCPDALGIAGAELFAICIELEPRWHAWVMTWLLVPIAALCTVGVMLAVVG